MSDRNNDTTATKVFVIILLLMSSSLLLIVLSSGNNGIIMATAQAPVGREPIATPISNNSTYALNLAHRLAITSVNASKTQARLGAPCMPELSRFILPRKEAKFDVIKQCVTITGKVVWTNYFNEDGDANFNVVLDAPYKNMLAPGSNSTVFTNRYGSPAIH